MRAGMRKFQLASALGLSRYTISLWKGMAPSYAIAYLELVIEYKRVQENLIFLQKELDARIGDRRESERVQGVHEDRDLPRQ